MKIYSKTGDRGETSLFSGERVPKNDLRVEASGMLDELNSHLGFLLAQMEAHETDLQSELRQIQKQLFEIGALVASTPASRARQKVTPLTEAPVQALEHAIDRMTAEMAPLTAFILPGGHLLAASAHVTRTVCRRTERSLVQLFFTPEGQTDPGLPPILKYMNRLADYLFVLARYLNFLQQLPDLTLEA